MKKSELLFDDATADIHQDSEWWEIYEESFPVSERESKEVLGRAAKAGVGKALRVRAGGKTVGLAGLHLLHHPPVAFLGFLAIDPSYRDQHIGGLLFQYALKEGCEFLRAAGAAPLGMLWEVEDPATADNDEDRNERERRIHFYTREGAVLLPIPYFLPPLHKNASIMPMRLMFRACDDGHVPDAAEQKELVWAMYFEKYARINGVDEQLLKELLHNR